ncbi:RICIN domain-containing protein [Nonomuraea harbinensis]|uniref:RICIN domain-containing protein n=1 Tax=Nonomuraea harbinensis TaxID=1286938 RepID=A0ABW1C8I4_9ACTN|nr:RICIN domain-containing protein [Nonomuraea harbinensis]
MRGSRPVVRMASRAATISVTAAMTAGFLVTGTAQADGTFRWQNHWKRTYLEVYRKSKSNGAIVNVWPYNGGKNQLWKDTKTSSGYYRVRNVHSGKSMDRWDQAFHSGYHGAACPVTQWSWWGGTQQLWKGRSVYSRMNGRRFTIWYNYRGCRGNAWHDTLGVLNPHRASNVILYSRDYCTEGAWIGKDECYWRRNGK